MNDVGTLGAFALELLALCETALATTVGGVPGRSYVSPGAPALDCCPQLTVHVQGLGEDITNPLSPGNAPAHRSTTGSLNVQTLVITIARCAPTSDEAGNPPPADALQAVALEVDEDVWAIWNHLRAAQRAGTIFEGRCSGLYFDQAVPLNTEGGCAGWTFQVRPNIHGYKVA